MRHVRWILGLALMALLLRWPEAAVNGAREAMAQWYYTVAPALFPFMALMPLLTGDAARAAYGGLLGGVMRRVFGLPGETAPALVIGMLAGSPAGSHAVRRVAAGVPLSRGQLDRLAVACCGLSPGFLVTGVGASMLGSAALGRVLLKSQAAAQLTLLLALKYIMKEGETVSVPAAGADGRLMGGAVQAILNVCGWMTLFGALAAVVRLIAGEEAGLSILCLMDVTSGARAVSALPMDIIWKLAALSGLAGFGGMCVCMQAMSALEDCGVRWPRFIAARAASAVLCAGLTLLQLFASKIDIAAAGREVLPMACLALCAALLPVLVRLKRNIS